MEMLIQQNKKHYEDKRQSSTCFWQKNGQVKIYEDE